MPPRFAVERVRQPVDQRGFVQSANPDERAELFFQPVAKPRREAAFAESAHAEEQDAALVVMMPQRAQTALQWPPPPDKALPRGDFHLFLIRI